VITVSSSQPLKTTQKTNKQKVQFSSTHCKLLQLNVVEARAAKLHQLGESTGEAGEENIFIPGKTLDVALEDGVPYESHISREHHQITRFVFVLFWASPLLHGPLLLKKLLEVEVGEGSLSALTTTRAERG